MTSDAETIDAYLNELPPERLELVQAIRRAINDGLPPGFEERMIYGMIGWVVPRERYPAGYHCDPSLPLPFINLGNQKASVNLYHMGIYVMPAVLDWFQNSWREQTAARLDMGKSCIRFKRIDRVPLALLGELAARVTVDEWITVYESEIKR
jgi:hypothetical protein